MVEGRFRSKRKSRPGGIRTLNSRIKSPLLYQVELRACIRNFYHIQLTSASSDSSVGSGSGEPENGLSTGFHRGARSVRSTGGRRCPGRLVDFVPPAGCPSEVFSSRSPRQDSFTQPASLKCPISPVRFVPGASGRFLSGCSFSWGSSPRPKIHSRSRRFSVPLSLRPDGGTHRRSGRMGARQGGHPEPLDRRRAVVSGPPGRRGRGR